MKWAEEFWVPEGGPYLLSHSVGCLMRDASTALERGFLAPWRQRGADAWPEWLAAIAEFRAALAALLGGDAAHYCPQTNLSSGLAKVMTALPPAEAGRNVVLASEHCFPSMAFVLERAAGYAVRFIAPPKEPEAALESWRRALAAPDVRAALITHVHYGTGVAAPAAQIAAECRRRGIVSILDVAQSAGILEIDVEAIGADVVLGSCVKWLCGGPGAGFLWVRPALIDSLTPADVGWFSHEDPFEFDPHHFRYATDARRFWGGTPSVAPFVTAAAAVRRLTEIGIEAVRGHNLGLQRLLAERIGRHWSFTGPETVRGGTCCIPTGARLARVRAALDERRVRFDQRADILRLSFHLYNDEADAIAVAEAFDAAAET